MTRRMLPGKGIHTGSLVLVNPAYAYQPAATAAMVPVEKESSTVLLNSRAAALLEELIKKAGGWDQITPVSGWRSREEQQSIWDAALRESGETFTRKFVAVPGHSEHETGLAIDLGLRQAAPDLICPAFPYEGVCNIFRKYAADYGFIERYPAGREAVTGIGHEPWHFRYVGIPHALMIRERGLTLEEYVDLLRAYPAGKRPLLYRKDRLCFSVSYLPASRTGDTVLEMDGGAPCDISGNNVDGFILTEWRERDGYPKNDRRA